MDGLFTPDDLRHAALRTTDSFTDVLQARRSEGSDLGPVHRRDLAGLLYLAARVVSFGQTGDGYPATHRPYPSAGATHAIDLMVDVHHCVDAAAGTYLFAPTSCQLHPLTLPIERVQALHQATSLAARRAEPAPITIYLVAQVERVSAKYDNGLSLLLRDAGACAATLHLATTSLGLRSTILGILGQEIPGPQPSPWLCCGAVILGT